MKLKNGVMLITYADSLGKNLSELHSTLNRFFVHAIQGIHILPFFPSSADRGFSPTRYDIVDSQFGSWEDIRRLSEDYYLMCDFMINHISSKSVYYQDFLRKKDASAYANMFLRYAKLWQGGEPNQIQLDAIYKRKPRAPFVLAHFADGSTEKIWCTFGDEQIDLNVNAAETQKFIRETLCGLAEKRMAIIRLDAFAYATKKVGTACFFEEPEVWELLSTVRRLLQPYDVEILPEIHEHYSIQMKLAEHGYWVYDFALPLLLLHGLYTGEAATLANWLNICPRKQFTTLDTHDGIGVVDVKGLLSEQQIKQTQELLYKNGANVKRIYSSEKYQNLDIYQINCTYYSALGNDDIAYLTARAVQIFAPGIPQIYYVGLLAGKNDIALVENTGNGRDINRHNYSQQEIEAEIERPVVKSLLKLLQFRNRHPAFSGGTVAEAAGSILKIYRSAGQHRATLTADLKRHEFMIEYTDVDGVIKRLEIF